ncbi:MAG: hypothetical protein GWN58_45155 [Anaerolineae bacterium]|nr:hypothetical protein [Anaerolineae bacterium]
MKTALFISLGIVVVIAFVVFGLALGWALWGRHLWAAGPFAAPGMAVGTADLSDCGTRGYGMGPGMMGRGGPPEEPCAGWGYGADSSDILTIEQAHEAVERYVATLDYPDLEIAEVMEFERNFYAIVREPDTGVGAMELLVDKWTGEVGPEMGPNMMWNAKYGMHGRGGMMGGASQVPTVDPQEAIEIAQRWLDTYRPGVTVEEHVDSFYGYYTVHTLEDGDIEGMLSVHATTGQVWYHTWHGEFVQMIEGQEGEGH